MQQSPCPYVVLVNGEFVAGVPAMQRRGLDIHLLATIHEVDTLIKEMREDIEYPREPTDENTAVKLYLLYTSMLVDCILPDIVMSAIAGHDIMVLMKQRLILEYSAKALHVHEHPDYGLFMMTVGEAENSLKKAKRANVSAENTEAFRQRLATMKERFPSVAGMKELTFDKIFVPYGSDEGYVTMYKAPSALVHGDPEGMRVFVEQKADGTEALSLTFPVEQVNAMLADAGRYAFYVCDCFVQRFRPGESAFIDRIDKLRDTFMDLILKHSHGRRPEVMADLREALRADDEDDHADV